MPADASRTSSTPPRPPSHEAFAIGGEGDRGRRLMPLGHQLSGGHVHDLHAVSAGNHQVFPLGRKDELEGFGAQPRQTSCLTRGRVVEDQAPVVHHGQDCTSGRSRDGTSRVANLEGPQALSGGRVEDCQVVFSESLWVGQCQ